MASAQINITIDTMTTVLSNDARYTLQYYACHYF